MNTNLLKSVRVKNGKTQTDMASLIEKDDRKTVAAILFENGYTVRQGKKKRTETGKSVDYTVIVTDRNGETADR